MDVQDRALGQALGRAEGLERSVRVSSDPVAEANPDAAKSILAERARAILTEPLESG
jgi:hypothetical protein